MNLDDIDFEALCKIIVSKWSFIKDEETDRPYKYIRLTNMALSKMYDKNPNCISEDFAIKCTLVISHIGLYPCFDYFNHGESSESYGSYEIEDFENAHSN